MKRRLFSQAKTIVSYSKMVAGGVGGRADRDRLGEVKLTLRVIGDT